MQILRVLDVTIFKILEFAVAAIDTQGGIVWDINLQVKNRVTVGTSRCR